MLYWDCEVPDCQRKACLFWGNCFSCGKHFCTDHVEEPAVHLCLGPDGFVYADHEMIVHMKRDVKDIGAKLDLEQLAAEASALRPGHVCRPPNVRFESYTTPGWIVHGTNIHIPFTFDDGVIWMARIRQRRQTRPPPPAAKMNLLSDAATFRVLHDGGVKVPQAFVPDRELNAELLYFFTEFIEGNTFHPFVQALEFIPAGEVQIPGILRPKIMLEIARWFISLEKLTFPLVGSPTFDQHGGIVIGPTMGQYILSTEPPFFLGPFNTAQEKYLAHFDTVLQNILDGLWCGPSMEIQNYLEILELRELVKGDLDLAKAHGPWYLKHGDPRGDHFRFKLDGDLTGVLDWEWAYTTSKADAFAAPFCFTDLEANRNGITALSQKEIELAEAYDSLSRQDLGDIVRNGKKFQLLNRMTRGYMHSVLELNAIRRAFLGLQDDFKPQPTSLAEWMEGVRERYKGEKGLESLLEKHGGLLPARVKNDLGLMEAANEVKLMKPPRPDTLLGFE